MRAVLEIAEHGGEDVIVRRIEVVDDGLGQRIFPVEAVQIGGQRAGLRKIADGIEAGVRAKLFEQAGVVVAQRAEVKLLGPALFRVEPPEEQHHEGGELRLFRG